MDNRESFGKAPLQAKPIIGYHCWALGFLDSSNGRAGCLLHPSRHGGKDLRGLVDYGGKCRRESCGAARVFDRLPVEGQAFWLPLVRGLNPFYFSSRRANPLFHILPWGACLLERLRHDAVGRGWSVTELLYWRPFLVHPDWWPKAHRYLFHLALEQPGAFGGTSEAVEGLAREILEGIGRLEAIQDLGSPAPSGKLIWTHQASEPPAFLDFLRLALEIERVDPARLPPARKAMEGLSREIAARRAPGEGRLRPWKVV
jgi:hypothetical protein